MGGLLLASVHVLDRYTLITYVHGSVLNRVGREGPPKPLNPKLSEPRAPHLPAASVAALKAAGSRASDSRARSPSTFQWCWRTALRVPVQESLAFRTFLSRKGSSPFSLLVRAQPEPSRKRHLPVRILPVSVSVRAPGLL